MKFHTEQTLKKLHPQLVRMLQALRARRGFEVEVYAKAKARMLNEYMRRFRLKSCVVAVSGGIDSAATLALVHLASTQDGSPIKKIVPISLPVFRSEFTTNQDEATDRGQELVKKFHLTRHVIDLTQAFSAVKTSVDTALGVQGEAWASGQLVSYVRTPAIYYVTSLLSQMEKSGIVCGTTNRDEGAYLGYVGKASDGMVDVQLISDLHKSEVRALAKHLGVPRSILQAVPTGDMYDGRVDEQVFGCGYDFVELFLLLRSVEDEMDREACLRGLSPRAREQYDILSQRVEDLHRYNGHKYLASSPAIHLDALESGVPGGWLTGRENVDREPKGKEYFVNAFPFRPKNWSKMFAATPRLTCKKLPLIKGEGYQMHEILNAQERRELNDQADKHGWKPVGIDGYAGHYQVGDKIGSYRASSFSPELAAVIWKRIAPHLPQLRIMADDTPTDWNGHRVWRAIGVSPLFRFIRYTAGGLLVPHYDGPYVYPDGHSTLMSLVMYVKTQNVTGGLTRFIKDPQINKSLDKKDYSDWKRFAKPSEVLFSIDPKPGTAIIFDHRILHDSLEIHGEGEKVILRTDIVYAKCPHLSNG